MTTLPRWRTGLDRFATDLRRAYGPRLRGLVLYGSRARGDAAEDADVDTLVLLDPAHDFWTEFARIGAIGDRVSLECDIVISAIPMSRKEFESGSTPLIQNARREGIRIE
ncbi:MAG: nucleotidyltransferase domain-containing protein [Planctomycetes bacterium]|nr:nucleotidyltransferase domain-containing protein [Planctomycetota bacterium]MBI3846138.1 nucleotidyltransferase domain-containing protein [Planctomycetota bacterium]